MKLYIPTTSLNFNNILSTESISPKGFYSLRGFGYSRWFTIPENDLEGIILLYESPAEIIRPASDLEDHPLLIEIDTDEEYPKPFMIGTLNCHAAGTIKDPFDAYDMTFCISY